MKLLRYLAAFVLCAGAASAASTTIGTKITPGYSRSDLAGISTALAASATYQHMYVSEAGYQALYDVGSISPGTCPSGGYIDPANLFICFSDATTGSTTAWILGVGAASLSNVAHTNTNNTFTKAQRSVVGSLSLSGSTATPDFDASQNFTLTLVHASCPCTMANPSTTLVAGQTGVIEVIQSGTGSDALAWGTQFIAAGGTSAVVLSTAAGARDYVSYYVADSTHIVISAGALNATH